MDSTDGEEDHRQQHGGGQGDGQDRVVPRGDVARAASRSRAFPASVGAASSAAAGIAAMMRSLNARRRDASASRA